MKILAVSGGVDSMSLLHMFLSDEVVVVHINHKTRGKENIKEEKLVQKICEDNNISFYKFDFFYSNKMNFHKEARSFRYSKFKEISSLYDNAPVYLAHHLDDQIENIFMNEKKIGSKLMREKEKINNLIIIRPLLNKTKQDIYKYAKINGVSFLEDSSNTSIKYLRNRIRKQLEDYTYKQKIQIYNEELLRTQNINDMIDYYKNKNKFLIEDIKLTELSIYCYLKSQGIISNISKNKLDTIIKFLKKNKNGYLDIDKEYKLISSYNEIYIKKNEEQDIHIINKIKVDKYKYYNFNNLLVYSLMDGFIRCPKSSDRIVLKNGHKKISRFFIDEKIPKEIRNIWPVFVDKDDRVIRVPKLEDVVEQKRSISMDNIFKEILVTEEEIDCKCLELAKKIESDYKDKTSLLFLGLLKGCHPFMTDLLRHVNLKFQVDYMDVSSFFGGYESQGEVEIIKDMTMEVKNRDVVIVEDIVDSGRTLKKVIELLMTRGAKSVEVVAMLDKPEGRVVDLEPKYVGKIVPKAFLIGYGLDYNEYFRTLRVVGIPKENVIKEKNDEEK